MLGDPDCQQCPSVLDTHRKQIEKSFQKAATHNPDEWTPIVPCVLTTSEHRFVRGLGGKSEAHLRS